MAKVTVPTEVVALISERIIPAAKGYKVKNVLGKYHLINQSNQFHAACGMILGNPRNSLQVSQELEGVPADKLCGKCFAGLIIRK